MGAKGHSRESMTVEPPSLPGSLSGNNSVLVAAVLAALVVVWAATNLVLGGEGFAVLVSDKVVGGEEAASALARLFAALVLGLFLADAVGWRARWVAGGLVVLGLGHFVFGYLEPLIQEDPPELNESLYEAFVTQTLACAMFMVGLFPGRPPRLVVWAATAIPIALVAGYVVLFEFLHAEEWMPLLSRVANPERTLTLGSPLVWLTPWHWALSALPLGLASAAVVGAFWQSRRGLLRSWLLIAVVLLAGSVLHDYLWPSAYGGGLLTTADALSLVFAVVVAIGGVSELRRVASERARLLATERERARRLNELNSLRSDFSELIAHELDTPIAAPSASSTRCSLPRGGSRGTRLCHDRNGAGTRRSDQPRQGRASRCCGRTRGFRDKGAPSAVGGTPGRCRGVREYPTWAPSHRGDGPRGSQGGGLCARRPRAYRAGLAQPTLERCQILARRHAHRAAGDRQGGAGQGRDRRSGMGYPPG